LDLSRAKTILIAAFLMLNLFLGYRLWYSPQILQSGLSLTGQDADKARDLLQNAGYELTVAIPRQVPRLSFLHVVRDVSGGAAWAEIFLGQGAQREAGQNGKTIFKKGESSVSIAPNGQVAFSGRVPMSDMPGGSEDDRQLVERFLRERGIWQNDLKFDLITKDGQESVIYRYVQTFQGLPLFFSTVDVTMSDENITEVVVYRVLPQGFSDTDVQVISALDAVEMFVENNSGPHGQRIIDISLGYFSQDYDAARWEIVPVWRIAASDGAAVYINAFTGETESPEM
jgi:regulatory protein YycI of two-component signal transduction system YycFG